MTTIGKKTQAFVNKGLAPRVSLRYNEG